MFGSVNLIFDAQSASKVISDRNTIYSSNYESKSESLFMTHLALYMSISEKIKLKKPGKHGPDRQNSWQQAKHPKVYSDLL